VPKNTFIHLFGPTGFPPSDPGVPSMLQAMQGVPAYGGASAPHGGDKQQQAPWRPMAGATYWDQAGLANAFSTMTLSPPPCGYWYMHGFGRS
jgi:hypothetical protein